MPSVDTDINSLGVLFGEDCVINDQITIHQPTIREICGINESSYWSVVTAFTLNPSDIKAPLWDSGIDWEQLSDFELFATLVQTIKPEESKILFGDTINFTLFRPMKHPKTGDLILYNMEQKIIIDLYLHYKIVKFLCMMHGITKNVDRAGNEHTKQILIDLNRSDLQEANDKKDKSASHLRTLVSAMVMYPGFKYDYQSVQNITYYQLLDAVQRSQIYTSSIALLQGAYSGMCDMSKVDKAKFNWLREAI